MHAARLPFLAIVLLLLAVPFMPAQAQDPCPQLHGQTHSPSVATRIAAVACQENIAWFRAFIDADGRSGGQPVYEAENDTLADGVPAWKKVAAYWNGSGLANDCAAPAARCRNFVVDTPWSAAFVSWVMRRAAVPGFAASSRHVDYVRAARRQSASSPYRLAAPGDAAPAPGDLLCYARVGTRALGYEGLLDQLDSNAGLPMHCDIVVAAEAGMAWLVGGNVQQVVALRMLRLDAQGRFADLPLRRSATSAARCSADTPEQCNLNRQDWTALLKLKIGTAGALVATSTH